jgi:hypothetical protein
VPGSFNEEDKFLELDLETTLSRGVLALRQALLRYEFVDRQTD